MKRADRNGRNPRSSSPESSPESGQDARSADRRIEEVLRRDRAFLAGQHDPGRSRARAMGLLAAAPVAETAGGGGFLSRLAGTKAAGAVAVIAGGMSLAVMLTAPPEHAPVPAAVVSSRTDLLPETSSEKPGVKERKEQREGMVETIPARTQAQESPRQNRNMTSTPSEEEIRAERKEMPPASLAPVAEEPSKNEPGVEERNSARTELHIAPIIIGGK